MNAEVDTYAGINAAVKAGNQPGTLRTTWEEVTYGEAIDKEQNMLKRLTYWQSKYEFLTYLLERRHDIEAIVAEHLGLTGQESCLVMPPDDWIHGSFNACVPVHVDDGRSLIARFPLPYKIGEAKNPGNSDEKLRCEAVAYAWINENCSEVPLPRLWGFAFSNGVCFSTEETRPMYIRVIHLLRKCLLSFFGFPVPVPYIRHRCSRSLGTGYFIMDCIEQDDIKMLSDSWEDKRDDKARRSNLFRDLSKIVLSLARVPLQRIGSFTINDRGIISLTNRPLTLSLQQLENEGIPINIARQDTYTTVEPYVQDLLSYHDSRLLHQPNSIIDAEDARAQMAALAGMRLVMPQFLDRSLRHGPFFFSLTDLHQSNIFVDEQWNIKYLIDMEWACSLPVEMQQPPYWLTSRGIDGLEGEFLSQYNDLREEFMEAFEKEERSMRKDDKDGKMLLLTRTMKRTWEAGSFFYFYALVTTTGMFNIFQQHIQSRYTKEEMTSNATNQALSLFWAQEAEKVIADKLNDLEDYTAQLRRLFEVHAEKGIGEKCNAEEEAAEESVPGKMNAEEGDVENQNLEEENAKEENASWRAMEQENAEDLIPKHGE